ncbi:3023_t:CDS:2 [Gigaspora rosea]|nr:3023_t:CDS:2 [Gigaspora rosea]
MSEANTPVSTSTSSTANGNESFTHADEIKKLDTDKLIKFLESQDLNLKKHHFDIIRDQEITGPASDLAKFIREFKERPFSSYKTQKDLKEILMKHRIDGNGIGAICQFLPKADENIDLSQRPPLVQLAHRRHQHQPQDGKRITKKELSIAPQLEFVGEENTGRVDYAIKALEELFASRKGSCTKEYFDYIYGIVMTATEWYFILYTTNGISCTSRDPLNIKFSESALKKDSEADIELQKNVKRVMEVIVGLLKDRTDVEKELAIKRQRVQKYFEK